MVLKSRRRYRKRKPYKKPATVGFVKRYVHSMTEDKVVYGDLNTDFSTVDNEWTEKVLNDGITQGTGVSNRIGNKIRIKSVYITGVITGGAADSIADDAYNIVRLFFGIWDSCTLTPLHNMGVDINTPIEKTVNAKDMKKKFKDKYLQFTNTIGHTGYIPANKTFSFYKKWKNGLLVTYDGTTSPAYTPQIHFSMISDSTVVTNPGINYGYYILRFEDA